MKFINLTPHAVSVYSPEAFHGLEQTTPTTWLADFVSLSVSPILWIDSSGEARISVKAETLEPINGIPFVKTTYGELTGIPEEVKPDDILIVSAMTREAAKASGHALAAQMCSPSKVVRNRADTSQILGCMELSF